MKKYQVISGKCFCKEDKISNSKTNEQINKQGLLQAESSLESIILEEQGLKRAYCSYIVFEELRKKYGSVNLFYFGLFCGTSLCLYGIIR